MTTIRVKNTRRDVCQGCGHPRAAHHYDYECRSIARFGVGPCRCEGFLAGASHVWAGPDSSLARYVETIPGIPTFFLYQEGGRWDGTVHVFFDGPVGHDVWIRIRKPDNESRTVRVWCRTGNVPDDLHEMAKQARADDTTAAIFLDALMERGLAREANA